MRLDPFLRETLQEIGVGELKSSYEPSEAQRFEISDEDAKTYREGMEAFFAGLSEKGFPAKDFQIDIGYGSARVSWERDRRFSDKYVLLLPLMQSAYNKEPKYDLPFDQLFGLFELGAKMALLLADGMQNPKLGKIDASLRAGSNQDPRNAWSELASLKEVLQYWFERLDTIDAGRVDFFTDWGTNHDFRRYPGDPGKPPVVTMNALMGPRTSFVEDRIGKVKMFDELFESIKEPLMAYQNLTFNIRSAYDGSLALMDVSGLRQLRGLSERIQELMAASGADPSNTDVAVEFGQSFRFERQVDEYRSRFTCYVPCLHDVRVLEAKHMEDYLEAANKDLDRVLRVGEWMKEAVEGHVTSFEIGYGHASLALEDDLMEALLEALTPHLNAIPLNDQRRQLRVRIVAPHQPGTIDQYGTITIPLGYTDPEGVKLAVDAYFSRQNLA